MKRGLQGIGLVMLLCVFMAAGTAGAALLEEDFDSYTPGENYWPTASDSWTSDVDGAVFSIKTSPSISGNSVKLEAYEHQLMHEFPRQTTGVVTAIAQMRNDNSGYRSVTFCLADDWAHRATYVTFQPDKIQYYPTGGPWTDVVSYSSDTWVKITLEIDLDAQTYDIYTDDVLRISDAPFNKTGVTGISKLYLDNSGPATGWVDDISITPEPATLCLLAMGGFGILLRRK